MSTTVSAKVNQAGVDAALRRKQRSRSLNASQARGQFYIYYSRTLTATEVGNFDGAGDYLELFTFPSNCILQAYSVTVPDMDAHATPTVTVDVMAGSTVLTNDSTTAQAGGTINGTPTGVQDVSDALFKLKIESAPATAQTTYTAFVVKALVHVGSYAQIG